MAELLVKAQEAWNHNQDPYLMADTERARYDQRSRIGDIIVVRPDGWQWGKEECPPRFIVVKLPKMSYDDLKHLQDPLQEQVDGKITKLLRVRKFQVPPQWVQQVLTDKMDSVDLTQDAAKNIFLSNIQEKRT